MGGVFLTLTAQTLDVRAGNLTRRSNIKSHGVFVGQNNSGDEVVLSATDLYYLADQLDVLENTIKGLSLQQNANIAYTYHYHTNGNGTQSSSTLYSASNPGGCYASAGHTHDKTGTCSWRYSSHAHTLSCYSGCPGVRVHVKDINSNKSYYECSVCDRSWYLGQGAGIWTGSSCDRSIVVCNNSPLNSGKAYTCGNPVNTWTVQCGKSNGQIIEAHIVFN